MLLKPKQLQLLKVGGELLANEAGKILSYLTPKDKYLALLNPKYLSNLANIANTGKANLSTIRGTEMPSARILAFLPKNIKTGIHGYQGKSIFDPNHKDNFGSLPNFIADNKLNAVRYVALHEELILPFLKSPMVPDSLKKMLIELFEDGIIAPLKQKGLKLFEISKFLESRANKAKKDPRIYDGTYKTLFEENPVTHEILNWKPEEYQSFVNNVDLFNQHLPTDIIKEFGGLHEVFVPGNGVYSKNIGGHYKDPLSANISLGYTGIPDIKNPQIIEITNTKKINGKPRKFNDLLDFLKSSAYKNAIEDNENLLTIIYGNVMDPLPGHTIATRNPGIIYIKKGNKLINKWKPKL